MTCLGQMHLLSQNTCKKIFFWVLVNEERRARNTRKLVSYQTLFMTSLIQIMASLLFFLRIIKRFETNLLNNCRHEWIHVLLISFQLRNVVKWRCTSAVIGTAFKTFRTAKYVFILTQHLHPIIMFALIFACNLKSRVYYS